MLKNVVLHSVATALANIVLPVPEGGEGGEVCDCNCIIQALLPGGPYNSNPFQGDSIPLNNCGY